MEYYLYGVDTPMIVQLLDKSLGDPLVSKLSEHSLTPPHPPARPHWKITDDAEYVQYWM